MENISKQFGDVVANDNISIDVNRGEVHALLGENGAGKTTLMNILYGLCTADEGTIRIHGKPVEITTPHKAIENHIGMVHQHFMLIPNLSITENIILGLPSTKPPFLQMKQAWSQVADLAQKYGLQLDPRALVYQLPVGMQQRVEILKALYRKTDLLILDEPTAVLTPLEVEALFKVIRRLIGDELAVIFISHKLNEVMAISDRVTVLRNGRIVGTVQTSDTDPNQLANMMVGREVTLSLVKEPVERKDKILEVQGLWVMEERSHKPIIKDLSLEIYGGEVLGIVGVDGNGQGELAEVIAGLRSVDRGRIKIKGVDATRFTSKEMIKRNLAYIPADRQRVGLTLDLSVAENLILKRFRETPYSNRGLILQQTPIQENATQMIRQFDIKVPHGRVKVSSLSGGNQQKVILARELSGEPDVLIAMQPTRGLDVESTRYVHECVLEQRARGGATLFISTELDEILDISDRIAVIYEGEIMGLLPGGEDVNLEQISLLMAGVKESVAENIKK
jgi:simple sugar transport system ATP-binding protein